MSNGSLHEIKSTSCERLKISIVNKKCFPFSLSSLWIFFHQIYFKYTQSIYVWERHSLSCTRKFSLSLKTAQIKSYSPYLVLCISILHLDYNVPLNLSVLRISWQIKTQFRTTCWHILMAHERLHDSPSYIPCSAKISMGTQGSGYAVGWRQHSDYKVPTLLLLKYFLGSFVWLFKIAHTKQKLQKMWSSPCI